MNAPLLDAAADLRARLVAVLDRHDRLAIAVSGGVDSLTLAHVAWRHSTTRATMYHAASPAVPAAARERVAAHAARHGWPLVVVDAAELDDPRYRANPIDRCYYCKTNLYARIARATADTIVSGTNRDDLTDFRPGLKAAAERNVVHPYVEAAIGKDDVYALAASLGLEDIERLPAQPCLSSRVETGIAIDARDLAFIDAVEHRLAMALGRTATVRCRVTHSGIVIELAAAHDAARAVGTGTVRAAIPDDAVRAVAAAVAARAAGPDDATLATLAATAANAARAAATDDVARAATADAIGRDACRAAGRTFAGVRPYARGAAFLHRSPHD